jgi:AcrR family transcriptional regulator
MRRSHRREHLIETATTLFCEHGYHATGIDKILNKARVSKKTLYTHFRSKEELILAVLRQYDGLFRNDFMRKVDRLGKTPPEKLLAVFDVAEAWFSQHNFYGCMFINAIGEYSEKDSPIRDVSKQFKQLIRDYIKTLCVEAGAEAPDALADQLALILEGAIVTAQVSQNPKAAQTAKDAAAVLIERMVKSSQD